MDNIWVRLLLAGIFIYMAWRLYPAAKDKLENGPRGSSKEWLNVSMLIGGVVLFVALLMSLV